MGRLSRYPSMKTDVMRGESPSIVTSRTIFSTGSTLASPHGKPAPRDRLPDDGSSELNDGAAARFDDSAPTQIAWAE